MSSVFEWSGSYSVGVNSIDAQHRNLFALGAELHAAMMAGQGKSIIGRVLDRLVDYIGVHFAHEERILRLHDYPGLAGHKAEHEALKQRVLQFQKEFESGRAVVTVQVLQFLNDWLRSHICGSDTRYMPFVRGIAP